MTLFWETLSFEKSPRVLVLDPATGNLYYFWQPKSEADIYGIRGGVADGRAVAVGAFDRENVVTVTGFTEVDIQHFQSG